MDCTDRGLEHSWKMDMSDMNREGGIDMVRKCINCGGVEVTKIVRTVEYTPPSDEILDTKIDTTLEQKPLNPIKTKPGVVETPVEQVKP
jgi:hypothetical protein